MNTKQIVENHIVNMHNISKACIGMYEVKKHHKFYDATKVRQELEERAKDAFVDSLEKELIKFGHRYKSEIVDEAKEFFGIGEDKKIPVGVLVNTFEVKAGDLIVETKGTEKTFINIMKDGIATSIRADKIEIIRKKEEPKYQTDVDFYQYLKSAKHPCGTPKFWIDVDEQDVTQLKIKCLAPNQKELVQTPNDEKWIRKAPSVVKLRADALRGEISENEFIEQLKAHREFVSEEIKQI